MKTTKALAIVLLCLALLLASTGCGDSEQSTDTTAPDAPANLTCTSACNAATRTFSWDAATDNDSGVDHYLVTLDGGGAGNLWTVLGNVTTYTFDAALSLCDGYHIFDVKAVDKAGNEGWPARLVFMYDPTSPIIYSVTASSITETSCTITWTINELSSCRVDYGTTTAYGSSEPAAVLGYDDPNAYSHAVDLIGLNANTTYHYQVRSTDRCGNEAVTGDYTLTTAP